MQFNIGWINTHISIPARITIIGRFLIMYFRGLHLRVLPPFSRNKYLMTIGNDYSAHIMRMHCYTYTFKNSTVFGCSAVLVFVTCPIALGSWKLLRCPHKRMVNIMKVYIERNNMQVELMRFRKQNVDLIHVYVYESREFPKHSMFTAYSLDRSNWQRTN